MKKATLYPAPHLEVRVFISDEMISNYTECMRLAELNDCEGGNCNTCSWKDVTIGDTCMCEIPGIMDQIGG